MTTPGASNGPARAKLAFLILTPVLLMTLAVVVVALIALADIGPATDTSAEAGLARVGDDLALVIVTDGGADAGALRRTVANWGILAPAVFLVAASLIAWWVAGRVRRTVDNAEDDIATAAAERESRLQEVVHELRTPLAVMGTNLELAGAGTSSKYLDAARRAIDRMSRTVDDLAGHGQLAVETGEGVIDLESVATAVAVEHEGPARARGLAVRLAGREPVLVRRVDPAAIRAALGNFMSNAMRLAPQGSEITLDWGELDVWAWVSVTDEGPGLAPHHHARVFERGWQGSHDRVRGNGSGLGMTIARQLTEAQGGVVTLESEEGGGATFALWLPLQRDADVSAVVAADHVHPASRPWSRSVAGV